ncbi:dihydroorotase [Phormidium tenue FACHB-886]|nr:dihydroorotase [Phormidium tenue FACHB-886]
MSDLLRSVRLLDPLSHTDRPTDVLIAEGMIQAIAEHISDSDLPPDTQIQDCTELVLGTGLVDLYSHSGEPGFESRETLTSLMAAAAAGGFTRVVLLPNTNPPLDSSAGAEWLRSQVAQLRGRLTQAPQLQAWGALTLGVKGEQMVELAELAADVVGFADGLPLQNGLLVRRLLEYGQPLGKPIALWCCDRQLAGDGAVREGAESMRLGIAGSPAVAETAALAALLELVAAIGTPVHLMRISTARSVELIRSAKAQGVPVTASVAWMHLLLNITDVWSYDPSLRLDPPLGNPEDQAALIQGIEDGTIDAIAIDHSPYTYEEKTVAFAEAPAGAIGLELALPLLWQAFVASGRWSPLTLWRCLSTNPVACLGWQQQPIAAGQPAELTLFDPQKQWQVTAQTLQSKSINTPWLGQELRGRVVRIWNDSLR